jgi:hypothetical protein
MKSVKKLESVKTQLFSKTIAFDHKSVNGGAVSTNVVSFSGSSQDIIKK